VKIAIIKCGAPGIYYKICPKVGLSEIEKIMGNNATNWGSKEGFIESYLPEQVISATGAGDTSIAAFLASIMKGYPLETCLELMVAMGAACVESYDALGGLKTLDELLILIKDGWKKQGEKE
jgi:sugar/nucleoside kinase (ribokinase family)